MKALLLLRSRRAAAYVLGVALFGALALTALRLNIPDAAPAIELLLFAVLGAAIGRFTAGAEPREAGGRIGSAVKTEAIDKLVRSIAKLIQTHLTDSDAFSARLDGATTRLAQHAQAGPVNDIVLALIEDNREMRNKLATLRSQLEESRLRALQLQNDLERTEEASLRDPVTLIGNRRSFDAALDEEMEKARRTGADFCLALADLDRFKLVNDRFGHLVGDSLLRLFGEILTKNVRSVDRVARYGGEEFGIMLPGAGLDDAVNVAERIRKVLESKQWTIEPNRQSVGKITVSLGVAKLRPGETSAQLLKRVDECLYEAKAKGRNCVVAESTQELPDSDQYARLQRAASG